MDLPGVLTVPYLAGYAEANKATCATGPSLVADIDSSESRLELSCVPGTGTLDVEFASYGLPNVTTPNGRFVRCGDATCTDVSMYWENLTTKTLQPIPPNSPCTACTRTKECPLVKVTAEYFASLKISYFEFTCASQRDCEVCGRLGIL